MSTERLSEISKQIKALESQAENVRTELMREFLKKFTGLKDFEAVEQAQLSQLNELLESRERVLMSLAEIEKNICENKYQLSDVKAKIRKELIQSLVWPSNLQSSIRTVDFRTSYCTGILTYQITVWTELECFIKFETTRENTVDVFEFRNGKIVSELKKGELTRLLQPLIEKLLLHSNDESTIFREYALKMNLFEL